MACLFCGVDNMHGSRTCIDNLRAQRDAAHLAGFREGVARCREIVKRVGASLRAVLEEIGATKEPGPRPTMCPHGRHSWGICPHCLGLNDVPKCPKCGSIRCHPLAGYVSPNPDGLFCPNCGERAIPEKKTPG